MSLQVQFNISEYDTLKKIQFTDTTGAYDASDNPGGYGSPNAEYSDIDDVVITFILPDGTNYEVTSSDLGGWLPSSSDTDVDISISTLTGGSLSEFPDGIYDVTYKVTYPIDAFSSVQNKVLLTGKASICATNMYSDLCECENYQDYCNIVFVDALIRAAIINFDEANFDYSDRLIKQALRECENNCINCN